MTYITYENWVLVDESDNPVKKNQLAKSFRGEIHIIKGGKPPHKPSSSGFVWTDMGEYYPSIFEFKWLCKE